MLIQEMGRYENPPSYSPERAGRQCVRMQSFIRKKRGVIKIWHQDANHIRHLMITSHIPAHRQVLTRTGTMKRTDIIPLIISIPILSIIPRKSPCFPRAIIRIPPHRNRRWMRTMELTRTARVRQRLCSKKGRRGLKPGKNNNPGYVQVYLYQSVTFFSCQ